MYNEKTYNNALYTTIPPVDEEYIVEYEEFIAEIISYEESVSMDEIMGYNENGGY